MKEVKYLVMSVGPIENNGTVKYLTRIGGKANTIVVLPEQFSFHKDGYQNEGIEVFIYNEKKYINNGFEFFGYKQRNCGGVGRQGIAEAVDFYADENTILFQLDDDTSGFNIRKKVGERYISKRIGSISSLNLLVNSLNEFYEKTGIRLQAVTGATPITGDSYFFAARKIFNNFIMDKEDRLKGEGFRYLCSDDVIYNYRKNIEDCVPLVTTVLSNITFTQNEGDRTDGNAPIYNKDCSWGKSFVVRMFCPVFSRQIIRKESNRILFRVYLEYGKIYPPIMLSDKDGNITHKLRIR